MFKEPKKFIKLLTEYLKPKCKVGGIELVLVENPSEYVFGKVNALKYTGKLPTYVVDNPKNIPDRTVNLVEELSPRIRNFIKLMSSGSNPVPLFRVTELIKIKGPETYIPQKSKELFMDYVNKNINKKFFEVPNYLLKFFEPPNKINNLNHKYKNLKIGFDIESFYVNDFQEEINFHLNFNYVKFKLNNGEIIDLGINAPDELSEIFESIQNEDRDFTETLFFPAVRAAGLLDNNLFYDYDLDYINFYLERNI